MILRIIADSDRPRVHGLWGRLAEALDGLPGSLFAVARPLSSSHLRTIFAAWPSADVALLWRVVFANRGGSVLDAFFLLCVSSRGDGRRLTLLQRFVEASRAAARGDFIVNVACRHPSAAQVDFAPVFGLLPEDHQLEIVRQLVNLHDLPAALRGRVEQDLADIVADDKTRDAEAATNEKAAAVKDVAEWGEIEALLRQIGDLTLDQVQTLVRLGNDMLGGYRVRGLELKARAEAAVVKWPDLRRGQVEPESAPSQKGGSDSAASATLPTEPRAAGRERRRAAE